MKRSLWTLGTILGIAVSLASYAVWFHFQQGRRCLRLWGAEAANTIRHAPRVELLVFNPPESSGPSDTLAPPHGSLSIIDLERAIDITRQPGLVHARHALIMDSSFEWPDTLPVASHPATQPLDDDPPAEGSADSDLATWGFALVFDSAQRRVTLLFDESRRRVVRISDGVNAATNPGPTSGPYRIGTELGKFPQATLNPAAMQALSTFQSRCRSR
jgi:hypothetical protein